MGREVTAESMDCISPGAAVVGVTRDEEGLDASEEQFRLLVESIEDYAIIMLDREGYVAGWNPGAARMKGYRAEEIIGCHFSLFYPPDLVEAGHPQDELELALAEGSYHEEGERVRKDDTRFWADVTITPVRDQTGELRGFAKVTRDITERKHMMELLERNRRQLIESQVVGGFGSWEWDVVANVTQWSDNLWRIYGLEPGNHPNDLEDVIQRTHPDDRELFRTTVQAAFEDGKPFAFDQQILHADGSVRTLQCRGEVIAGDDGAPIRMLGSAQDITERRRAEQELRASEEQFRLLVESIEDYAIIMLDREGYVAGWNPGAARMKGYRAEEIIGCHFSLFYPPDLVEAGHPQDELELALAEGSYHEEGERVRKDDTRFWADVTITPVRDQTGELRGFAKVTRDITERKRAEEARLEVEDQFRAAFGDAPIGMALVGRSGRFLRVNQALCALVGYGESELLTKTVGDLTDPAEQAAGDDALRRLFRGELRIFQVERRYRHRYGESVQSMTSVSLVRDRAGSPSYAIAQVQDISERKQAEEVLACRAEQRQALTRLTDIALRSHTLGDLLSELVASVARTLDVEACTVSELSPPQDSLTVVAAAGCADHISASISAISASMWGHTLDEDRPMIVENYATETRFGAPAILADAGVVSSLSAIIAGREQRFGILSAYGTLPRTFDEGQVAFLQDVANLISAAVERLRSEERSRYLALHDVLTGLANRTLAEKNLELALARRRRHGGAVTVFLVDLDGFKVINDSLGHQVGDELLIALASRLRNAVRETDTVARFGGDEFVILAEDGDSPRSSSRIADRLTAAINQPIVLAASEHHMTAAIGIAFAPDNDATPAGLLRDADIAMYRAKSRGRGHRGLFDAQMRAEVTARLRIETDLREAIDNHELCVHYQPIILQATGRPAAVEALVRWKHSERGFISPAEFIPIAEETGMILALGAMVMEIAITQVAAWQQQFGVPLAVCVNTSAREIANPGFSARVADVVKRNGLSPETLSLEITERVLLKEADTPQGVLTELRAGGVGLMLDDFGTGYSSMSTLQRFQLDTLKIDKSFVDRLGSGPESLAIVQAIIGLARGLQMRIVAEGVETQLQKDTLVELGCDYLQGYLLARPMPADTAESYLRETLIPTAPTQMVGLPGEILR